LVHIAMKQVTVILSLTATPCGKKSWRITHSESQNTLAMIFQIDSCVLIFFTAFKKLTVTITDTWTWQSLPHTMYLTYEEFLLLSLSLSLGIWWYSAVLHNE
jgi:hypothetical protein